MLNSGANLRSNPNTSAAVLPFGREYLVPVMGQRLGPLACLQGVESGEIDDRVPDAFFHPDSLEAGDYPATTI